MSFFSCLTNKGLRFTLIVIDDKCRLKEGDNMKQKISITGMNCEHCVKRIEEGLDEVEGIEKVKVKLKKGEAKVVFDESKLTPEEIVSHIKEIGFEANL